jgi:hypothetical protein
MEAGAMALQKSPVVLRKLVGRTVTLLRPNAAAKGVTLSFDVIHEEPAPDDRDDVALLTDGMRLCQVLNNLVGNAIKFTPEGGRISITATRRSDGPEHDLVRVSVTDTGVGVDKAAQSKLFQPFSQTAVGASQCEGTGLGLAISKLVLDAMGGRIGVESDGAALGSTFWFDVKLKRVDPHALRPISGSWGPGDGDGAVEATRDRTGSAGTHTDASSGTSAPSTSAPVSPAVSPDLGVREDRRHLVPRPELHDPAFLSGRRVLVAEDNKTNGAVLCRQLKAVGIHVVGARTYRGGS